MKFSLLSQSGTGPQVKYTQYIVNIFTESFLCMMVPWVAVAYGVAMDTLWVKFMK